MAADQPTTADLLVEIGTEELPPKALPRLASTFAERLAAELTGAALADPPAATEWFATPRRLAVRVTAVRHRQPDQTIERRGPALAAAFDADGQPTRAALGFARSCAVPVEALTCTRTAKGEWLVFRHEQPGNAAAGVIPGCIETALRQLPIPKRMRWGAGDTEFVRPVHWAVVLHGQRIILTPLLSVKAGNRTYGHRFHHPAGLVLDNPAEYPAILEKTGYVIADFGTRRERIRQQIARLEKQAGGRIVVDPVLLDQVTALVEWPVALLGRFDPNFLEVPPEVLVSSMRDHQRYFHVVAADGALRPYFVTVANIKSRRPARVRDGNQRVLHARLADALFFWRTDLKQPLVARRERLRGVLFHQALGTVYEKSIRLAALAGQISEQLKADPGASARAGALAKVDLVTDLVGEFPDLQGIMGRYYARHDGEPAAVCDAIAEHYRPRFAGDALPQGAVARSVALADKVDSLTGIFIAGEEPSGDKDPYGLRRAALGTLRILIEGDLDLDLRALFHAAGAQYQMQGIAADGAAIDRAFVFTMDRLRSYHANHYRADEIAAVAALALDRPRDFGRRLAAVRDFRALPQAAALAAANKRIRNILRKAGDAAIPLLSGDLLVEPAEQELARLLVDTASAVWPMLDAGCYTEALTAMAGIHNAIDRFFDAVLVLADDPALRDNRLALLGQVQRLFLSVADISSLQP